MFTKCSQPEQDAFTNEYNLTYIKDHFKPVYESKHKTSVLDFVVDEFLSNTWTCYLPEDKKKLLKDYKVKRADPSLVEKATKDLKNELSNEWITETFRCMISVRSDVYELFESSEARKYLDKTKEFYTLQEDPKDYKVVLESRCLEVSKVIKWLITDPGEIRTNLQNMCNLYRESDRFVGLMFLRDMENPSVQKIFDAIKSFYSIFLKMIKNAQLSEENQNPANERMKLTTDLFEKVKKENDLVEAASKTQDLQFFDSKNLVNLTCAYFVFQIMTMTKKYKNIELLTLFYPDILEFDKSLYNLKCNSSLLLQTEKYSKDSLPYFMLEVCNDDFLVKYFRFYEALSFYCDKNDREKSLAMCLIIPKVMYKKFELEGQSRFVSEDADIRICSMLRDAIIP